jgi:hypothetical protein
MVIRRRFVLIKPFLVYSKKMSKNSNLHYKFGEQSAKLIFLAMTCKKFSLDFTVCYRRKVYPAAYQSCIDFVSYTQGQKKGKNGKKEGSNLALQKLVNEIVTFLKIYRTGISLIFYE